MEDTITRQDQEFLSQVMRHMPLDRIPKEVKQRLLRSPPELTALLTQAFVQNQTAPVAVTRPPLVGRVVKNIIIPAYEASNFAEAVGLGQFDNDTTETIRQFAKEQVGLAKSTKVDLVQFDRDWWSDEAIAWGVANGNKSPIKTAHTMGIAIKLPNEQREAPIVALGSVQGGSVLCLYGVSGWRSLDRNTVEGHWDRSYLVGFVSE